MPITRKQLNAGMEKLSESIYLTQEARANKYVQTTLAKEYSAIQKDLSTYLESFYGKYADTNSISYNRALQKLTTQELRQFKNEITAAINKLKTGGATAAQIGSLTRISGRSSLTRLEALNTQIQADIAGLATFKSYSVTQLLGGVFADSYYRTNYGLQNSLGIGLDLSKLTKNQIRTAVFAEFQGSTLGARLSAGNARLLSNVTSKLTQGLAAGYDLKAAEKLIASELGVSFNQLNTLVQTETNRLCGDGNGEAISYVCDEYQIVAILDAKTTEICQEMGTGGPNGGGKIFKLVDMTPGVNAPPFHYNCRTTTAPYFNSNVFNEKKLGQTGRAGWGIDSYQYGDWLKENGIEI